MKILIIGGTGLISTAITEHLLARGDEVTHYNRGLSAQPGAGVRTIHGDRTDHATFEQQMAEAGRFDCVMDMVGYKPEDGPSVVQAFTGRADHFIFCSTVDVYTKPAAHYPIREDAPREPSVEFSYAYHNVIIENTLLDAHARGDLPLTIIRPAYTYGEGRGMRGPPICSKRASTYALFRSGWGTPRPQRPRTIRISPNTLTPRHRCYAAGAGGRDGVTIADIFRHYGPTYRQQWGDRLLPSHQQAMTTIEQCRTAALPSMLLTTWRVHLRHRPCQE